MVIIERDKDGFEVSLTGTTLSGVGYVRINGVDTTIKTKVFDNKKTNFIYVYGENIEMVINTDDNRFSCDYKGEDIYEGGVETKVLPKPKVPDDGLPECLIDE